MVIFNHYILILIMIKFLSSKIILCYLFLYTIIINLIIYNIKKI